MDPAHDDDQGGDSACWLHRVCDACGALVETDDHDCPRRRMEERRG